LLQTQGIKGREADQPISGRALRLAIVLLYTAPAAIAGYYATQGIAQPAMPSPTWQTIFSIVCCIAVGSTAFIRIFGASAPAFGAKDIARA
jgi:hypothetical protein